MTVFYFIAFAFIALCANADTSVLRSSKYVSSGQMAMKHIHSYKPLALQQSTWLHSVEFTRSSRMALVDQDGCKMLRRVLKLRAGDSGINSHV